MTDKLKESIQRAEAVQRLLENEHLQTAWEDTQADIWRMWAATRSDEADKREELYRELHGLKAVRARLQRVVNEGTKAEAEVEAAKRKQQNAARLRST